jgi:excisionase family DNA binding protein
MASPSEVDLLTPAEVGRMLRISLSTVYGAASSGRIPAVTLWRGRRRSLLRFRRTDIEALVAARVAPSAPRGVVRPR